MIKYIFILKHPSGLGKTVETGVDPCLPNCSLGESHQQLANVGLNVGT